MKKVICAIMSIMILLGYACAETVTAELWQHEAGWISFSVALAQDSMKEVWEASAKRFGANIGMDNLTGEQLKMMSMRGYSMENGVDELKVEGNRFSGKLKDGTELFNCEYSLVEVLEEDQILGGVKVYVFKADSEDVKEYTYLLMTEPLKTEKENVSYVTFNLLHTQNSAYRALFSSNGNGSATLPCTMIERDTGTEGLTYVIERLYSQSIPIR